MGDDGRRKNDVVFNLSKKSLFFFLLWLSKLGRGETSGFEAIRGNFSAGLLD